MQAERKVSFPHITLLDVSFSMRYESVGSDKATLEMATSLRGAP